MAVPLYNSTTLYNATGVGYDGLGDGITTMPTLGVFIAFDGLPYDVDPVFTEVTTYVTNVTIDRGRSNDFSPFVSTAQVVFQNNERLFDPFNTAGTYFGKLLPRKQIKIVAMNNGVLYSVFRGFVEGFPVYFTDAGYASTVSVQCFDLLALLSQTEMPDPLETFTKTLNPILYYRMNNPQGSQLFTDSIGDNSLLKTGSVDFSSRPPITTDLNGSSSFLPLQSTYDNTPSVVFTNKASISFWCVPNASFGSGLSMRFGVNAIYIKFLPTGIVNPDSSQDNRFEMDIYSLPTNGSGQFTVYYQIRTPANSFTQYQPHHIAVTFESSTLIFRVYIDGVMQTTTNTTYFEFGGGSTTFLGLQGAAQFQEVSAYDYVLTQAQVTNLFNNAGSVYIETTAARFNRIIGYTNCSATRAVASSATVATVSEIDSQGTPVVDALNNTVNAEYGFMFCDKDGKIQFKDRNYIYTNTTSNTSQTTFGTGGIPFEPQIEMQFSGDQIRNDITVSFSGQGTTKKTNTTSVAAFGTNGETVDTQLSTIAQAKTLATYVSTVAGNLTTNLSPLKVGVTKTQANYATVLALELLDRTTVVVAPKTGSSFTKVQLLNRISHSITTNSWDITVDGSEQFTAWFIVDKSIINGADLLLP